MIHSSTGSLLAVVAATALLCSASCESSEPGETGIRIGCTQTQDTGEKME